MSVDWRTYCYERLVDGLTVVAPENVYGSGSLDAVPEVRPFAMLTFGDELPTVANATRRTLSVYFHDDPGDYLRIEQALAEARLALEGQVLLPDGLQVTWIGNSGDLSEDTYRTITRYASFDLHGRN